MKPRFSLAALLAVVGFCGIGFAALRFPSYLAASALFTLALGVLTAAGINVIYMRGDRRVFWVGFLISGGVYFTASFGFSEQLGARLVTAALLDIVHPYVVHPRGIPFAPKVTIGPGVRGPNLLRAGSQNGITWVRGPTEWELWSTLQPYRGPGFQLRPFGGGVQTAQMPLVSTFEPFHCVGHSVLTLFIAFLGGILTRCFFSSRQTPNAARSAQRDMKLWDSRPEAQATC
jgi:hypothetical protein